VRAYFYTGPVNLKKEVLNCRNFDSFSRQDYINSAEADFKQSVLYLSKKENRAAPVDIIGL